MKKIFCNKTYNVQHSITDNLQKASFLVTIDWQDAQWQFESTYDGNVYLKPPDAHQNWQLTPATTWGGRQARWRTRVKLSKHLSDKLYLTKMQHHLRHLPQHQGAFYSDYSTWFFDYQSLLHTVPKTKTRKGKGPKTCLPFCFAWAQALAFSNTGLVFDVFLAPVQVALSNMTHTCC